MELRDCYTLDSISGLEGLTPLQQDFCIFLVKHISSPVKCLVSSKLAKAWGTSQIREPNAPVPPKD